MAAKAIGRRRSQASGKVRKIGGRWWAALKEYAGLATGVAFIALALNWFLVPNRIAAGGVSGIATLLHHLFGFPVGVMTLVLNIPLFLVGLRIVGLHFGFRSILGFLLLGVFIDVSAPFLTPLTTEPLLAAVYGGGLTGIGVALTYRFGGSTGGTVLAARMLYRLLGLSAGRALLLLDGLVILSAGIVFNAELALYALLAVLVQTQAIDLVEEGQPYAKAAWIISSNPEAVAERVMRELDRGATAFQGAGMYTRQERTVLLVIVSRGEVGPSRNRELGRPERLLVISDAIEVLGEGSKPA